jgi:hypothetical protein
VEVRFTGLVVQAGFPLTVRVTNGDGTAYSDIELPTHNDHVWDGIEARRVAPASWPPRGGDLWRGPDGAAWWFYYSETPAILCRRDQRGSYEEKVEPARLLEQGTWELIHRSSGDFDEEPPF